MHAVLCSALLVTSVLSSGGPSESPQEELARVGEEHELAVAKMNEASEVAAKAWQGNLAMQHLMGTMYYHGDGVQQCYEQAFAWYTLAATRGYTAAQLELGNMFHDGKGANQSNAQAVQWWEKAAHQGDGSAQVLIGTMYRAGEGISIEGDVSARGDVSSNNAEEAARWFQKAADQGNSAAHFRLGDMYYQGEGVPKSEEKGAILYHQAAEGGVVRAQAKLAYFYSQGMNGVEKSYPDAARWYLKAANQGDADSQFTLGSLYRSGIGVEQNDQLALGWWLKAAASEEGHGEAAAWIGDSYARGVGVEQSYEDAVQWLSKAADLGNVEAMNTLSDMHMNGKGVSVDKKKGAEWARLASLLGANLGLSPQDLASLEKRAEGGDAEAQFQIAGSYWHSGHKNEAMAIEAALWLTKAADQGHADAQYRLSKMCTTGHGVTQDQKRADELLLMSAKSGLVKAQHAVAMMYYDGIGLAAGMQDYAQAREWWAKAADAGDAAAEYRLGLMHHAGQGVEQSDVGAVEWWTRAAAKDHPPSQYRLSEMYFRGSGVEMDMVKAADWLHRAAEYGETTAQFALAGLYFGDRVWEETTALSKALGNQVPKSKEQAAKWYKRVSVALASAPYFSLALSCSGSSCTSTRVPSPCIYKRLASHTQAAQSNHASAMFFLATMYFKGDGVPQSNEMAEKWTARAANQGHPEALAHMANTEAQLTLKALNEGPDPGADGEGLHLWIRAHPRKATEFLKTLQNAVTWSVALGKSGDGEAAGAKFRSMQQMVQESAWRHDPEVQQVLHLGMTAMHTLGIDVESLRLNEAKRSFQWKLICTFTLILLFGIPAWWFLLRTWWKARAQAGATEESKRQARKAGRKFERRLMRGEEREGGRESRKEAKEQARRLKEESKKQAEEQAARRNAEQAKKGADKKARREESEAAMKLRGEKQLVEAARRQRAERAKTEAKKEAKKRDERERRDEELAQAREDAKAASEAASDAKKQAAAAREAKARKEAEARAREERDKEQAKWSKEEAIAAMEPSSGGLLLPSSPTHSSTGAVTPSSPRRVGTLTVYTNTVLGGGSNGTKVYRGRHADGRAVAVKVMLKEAVPEHRARREMQLLQGLAESTGRGRDHVIQYRCIEEAEDKVLLAMELCECSLHDVISMQKRQIPFEHQIRIVRELSEAVDFLHEHGVVHRDIR
jgi:TPR repeat protein